MNFSNFYTILYNSTFVIQTCQQLKCSTKFLKYFGYRKLTFGESWWELHQCCRVADNDNRVRIIHFATIISSSWGYGTFIVDDCSNINFKIWTFMQTSCIGSYQNFPETKTWLSIFYSKWKKFCKDGPIRYWTKRYTE